MRSRIFMACLVVCLGGLGLGGCTSSGFKKSTDLSADACLSHAKRALYDADFADNLVVSPEQATVSGRHGGYTATLSCGAGDHLVRVDVHGLDSDQDDWYKTAIIAKF